MGGSLFTCDVKIFLLLPSPDDCLDFGCRGVAGLVLGAPPVLVEEAFATDVVVAATTLQLSNSSIHQLSVAFGF
jgi:hypothetical protein